MTIRLVTENGRFVPGVDPEAFAVSNAAVAKREEVSRTDRPKVEVSAELPMLLSIQRAMYELGIGKTKIFSLMKSGVLERVRIDGRSLVTSKSLKELAGDK